MTEVEFVDPIGTVGVDTGPPGRLYVASSNLVLLASLARGHGIAGIEESHVKVKLAEAGVEFEADASKLIFSCPLVGVVGAFSA